MEASSPFLMMAASAALFIALITPVFAQDYLAVGAKATTWRAGDTLMYRFGCHDAEAIISVAKARSMELFSLYGDQDPPRCFVVSRMIPAVLVKWIAGPFKDIVSDSTGSVWEILDVGNEREFIWLFDGGGAHPRIRARET